jgi:hypothetical protein
MVIMAGFKRLNVTAAGVGFVLIAAMLGLRASAQVATTTVQGTVYLADGGVASGTLLVSWPSFSTAANQAIAAGSVSATIGPNGYVSLQLAPNSGAYPAGTYYTAVYHLSDGSVSREYWVVPATTSTTIGAVRAQLAPATVAVQPVSKSYVDDSIAAITGNYVPLAGGSMSGPLQLSGDPVSTNQAATKHYADDLAAAELPLTGGSLSGALNTPNQVNKLPRVDVRHPDFGVGCSNAADPSGQQDSTCAVEAAVAWAVANPQGRTYPDVYFPAGVYKISAPLHVSCYLHVVGDGPQATIIEQTNNSANAFTIYAGASVQPNLYTCNGSLENMTIYAPSGHLYTATLVELQNATGYTLFRVRGSNGGGRGLSTAGNTERLKAVDTEWDTVRWPIVANGNELKFLDTQIAAPGSDASGYCFDINCVNGVFPGNAWTVAQQLISATGNGSTATYVIKGGSDTGSTNGVSPLLAGHWFTVAGISNVIGLNGVYQILSVANNTPASGEYTVTAANAASGTATVTGASYKPTMLPENRAAAFYMSGAAINVLGGSIKANWHEGCFEASGTFSGLIQGFYCEGYPVNGQPHLEAGVLANGLPPWTSTTGPIAANVVPVASTQWFPAYINDPNDIVNVASNVGSFRIVSKDFARNSTTPSVDVSGVQQGQFENVTGIFSGDGSFHIESRNQSGSTAPANTAWPVGSIIAQNVQANYGTLKVSSSHLDDIDTPGGNWAVNCNDASSLICSEAVVGSIPNGYTTFSATGSGAPNAHVDFDEDEWWGLCSTNETVGQGCIKVSVEGYVTKTGGDEVTPRGETAEALNGEYLNIGNVYGVQESDGSYAWVTYYNPRLKIASDVTNGPFYESMVDHLADPVLGANPGSSFAMGHQFAGSSCWYDVPSSGQSHALNRFCMKGGPGNTGTNAGWEYDIWNGSAWVNAFGISAQNNSTANEQVSGSFTAAEINSELTVDGVTYSNVNAAWGAAVALANASGRSQTVRLGPGMFNVTATMTEPSNGACVNLVGSAGTTVNAGSSATTTLTVTANLNGDVFYLGNTAQAQGCTFRDFVLLANASATHGFELQWFRGLLIDNVAVNDTTADGVLLGEESATAGHQANFLLRNLIVSYNVSLFTPASRPAYGVHLQKTAIDSHMDDIVVRNALTAAVYNEGTGNTGYLVHGFGYPYTCTTAPCANNAASASAANASYATSYVVDDVGGGGSVWTDTYADSPSVAGFYIGANGVAVHGGHIQWPDLVSFPAANLAYVAASVTNDMLIADVSCLGMNSAVNWITYAGTAGNPPTFTSVHNLTGCGNYVQDLNPAQVTGFSSGGANIDDPSGAVPRVWATPIAAASSYPAFSAQFYSGYQGDALQAHFSGTNPFFEVTYQGTIKSTGGIALSTVINTASALTLTPANKNVIANAAGGAQTITLPSCYTAWLDKASPAGLELTIIKSDSTTNVVTLQTVSSQQINYAGVWVQTLAMNSAGKRTLLCGPDYNWYAY